MGPIMPMPVMVMPVVTMMMMVMVVVTMVTMSRCGFSRRSSPQHQAASDKCGQNKRFHDSSPDDSNL